MKKLLAVLILIVVYLIALAVFSPHGLANPDAIATRQAIQTYQVGKQQFIVQLTAMATEATTP